jgi:hypothetical protein
MSKDSIKIKIIFNGKSLTVDVSKNKPFKILREKAHAFFYPLPQSYSFYEKKIDLSTMEEKLLGDIFGTRNLIILTIKENSSSANKLNGTKMFCKECVENQGSNEIAYYCRDCNSFICKNCRLNSESGKHYNHSIIQLFDNNDNKGTKRNVELYKQLLMNDINIVKNKINKCMAINNNKVDFSSLKKTLFEKVLLIGKLLYKKNEEIEKIEEEQIIKDKTEVETIRNDLEFIRNDNNILEISNDPLIEFNKINEFDKKLMVFNNKLNSQINNSKIKTQIITTEKNVENLFDKINNA